jgi:ArsR family transcriptional regulator, arsenate/arsenite/antimonite-responsive transcriptional repressor
MESSAAISALGALAQDSRLAVFQALVRTGPAGLQPSQLAQALGIPPNTLSFHLKTLRSAGLVRQHRQGRAIHYRADYECMQALLQFLTHDCCNGQACALTPQAAPLPALRKARRA